MDPMRLRCALLGLSISATGLTPAATALAQQNPQPQENRGGVHLSLDKSRNTAADGAHAKALAGDCKGALDLYDEALRHSIDASLYRDRGLCHEKLGNVYPAIDDYRAYVSQSPDAADADKYRARLDDLMKTASQDIAPDTGSGGDFNSEMRGGMTDGSTPVTDVPKKKKDDDTTAKTHPEDPNKPLTTIEYEEDRDRETQTSAMRGGRGFVLGAYVYPRYVFNPWAFQFGQGVGAKFGYSFGELSTLFVELGFMSQLSTGSDAVKSGFTGLLGYEVRIPLDRWATNQIVLSGGAGFENLTDDTIGASYASFVGRGRAGYRHVFGKGFALEFLADGGLMATVLLDAPTGAKNFGVGGFVGGLVALNVGF